MDAWPLPFPYHALARACHSGSQHRESGNCRGEGRKWPTHVQHLPFPARGSTPVRPSTLRRRGQPYERDPLAPTVIPNCGPVPVAPGPTADHHRSRSRSRTRFSQAISTCALPSTELDDDSKSMRIPRRRAPEHRHANGAVSCCTLRGERTLSHKCTLVTTGLAHEPTPVSARQHTTTPTALARGREPFCRPFRSKNLQ